MAKQDQELDLSNAKVKELQKIVEQLAQKHAIAEDEKQKQKEKQK